MNTKDIVKYLLIAAGAYLLYEWLSSSGYLAQWGIGTSPTTGAALPTGASSPSTQTSLVSAPVVGTATSTSPPVVSTSQAPTSTSAAVAPRTQIATIPNPNDGSYIPVYSDGTMGAPVWPTASTSPSPSTTSLSTVQALVAAASQGDSYLNGGGTSGSGPFDHWAYYYNQTAYGQLSPSPGAASVGVDPNASITLAQFMSAIQSHVGLSGLSGLSLLSAWGLPSSVSTFPRDKYGVGPVGHANGRHYPVKTGIQPWAT